MNFTRTDRSTSRFLYLLLSVLGLAAVYGMYENFPQFLNLIGIPIMLLSSYSGFKKFRNLAHDIYEIRFSEDKLQLLYLDGKEEEFEKEKISYAILVKKYIQPVRALEFRFKSKNRFGKKRYLGRIYLKKWPKLEAIGTHLIQDSYENYRWRYGRNVGDLLLLAGMILGLFQDSSDDFLSQREADLSTTLRDTGDIWQDHVEKKRNKEEQIQAAFKKKQSRKP